MSSGPESNAAPTLRSSAVERSLARRRAPPLRFKQANLESEFEQIHRLNHETFAREIPQHAPQPGERLVDKFHTQNTYFICLEAPDRPLLDKPLLEKPLLAGMLAVRAERPFSLDHKLPQLDAFLPPGSRVCEVRLLAIQPSLRGARGGRVLAGLLALLWQYASERGMDGCVISGTTRQLKLYRHLGFVPFGPLVGEPGAQFQPMYVSRSSFEAAARGWSRAAPEGSLPAGPSSGRTPLRESAPQAEPVSLLPGPVPSSAEVRRAFERPAESHRSPAFHAAFHATQQQLCELTCAPHVQLLLGSGTLANDVVAGQLTRSGGRGLVLSNGEFGERLIDHARRFQLDFEELRWPWGAAFDYARVQSSLCRAAPAWLWCVHCETSTGVLNDLGALQQLCAARGVKLCVDAVSSLGAVPVDLRGVHLASSSSGKALRAYPGVGLVFHRELPEPAPGLPRYLDLGSYARAGTPFSFSSNLLCGLQAALQGVDWSLRFERLRQSSAHLRARLAAAGFELVAEGARTSPAVLTLGLPAATPSESVGRALEQQGFFSSYNSGYLRERNWLQICLMAEPSPESLQRLVEALVRVCRR